MNKRKNSNKSEIKTKTEKKVFSTFFVKFIAFSLISILLSLTVLIKDKIENFINFSYNGNALSTIIEENGLIIHFINVGQGDATLIEFPNNEIMIIDCGDNSTASQGLFISYLNTIDFETDDGEKVIDYLVLTHPDEDHIGGAEYIFDNFKVESCYRPDVYSSSEDLPTDTSLIVQSDSEIYADVITKLNQEVGCISICTVQELEITSSDYDSTTATADTLNWIVNFYAPVTSELPYRESSDLTDLSPVSNDYSPIMILSYMGQKIMFTGDASEDVEADFIDYYDDYISTIDFDIDILKIGHHGSRYSTTDDLLEFVDPEYAIISVGENSYGHPSIYTLERLNAYGLKTEDIYRTDLNGDIMVGISQTGEISLKADVVQYSTFEFQWWEIYLILELIILIIIFFPNLIKLIKKLKINNKNKAKINEK